MDRLTTGIKKVQHFGSSGTLAQEMESNFIVNRILPTQTARDWKGGRQLIDGKNMSAKGVVRPHLLPTPRANKISGKSSPHFGYSLHEVVENGQTGMKLQPNFVEWMMGFPKNWTNLEMPTEQND